ncbi:hypothetical protein, partial [Klebsiella aerogenes]|uniref:hypothetical protein n=1 Tax=Klebsiella aerogenes TaxID=548 RepID=UPI001BCE4098
VSTALTSFFFRFFTAVDYKMGSPWFSSRGRPKKFFWQNAGARANDTPDDKNSRYNPYKK